MSTCSSTTDHDNADALSVLMARKSLYLYQMLSLLFVGIPAVLCEDGSKDDSAD